MNMHALDVFGKEFAGFHSKRIIERFMNAIGLRAVLGIVLLMAAFLPVQYIQAQEPVIPPT